MEKIKVLIVEDELLVAQDLKYTLQDHNFEVIDVSDNGEDVLRIVINNKPDLILMDIQLAGQLDGIETAEKLSKNLNIPIIYLSDHIDEETVSRAKNTQPAGYLSKPFKAIDVLNALELAFINSAHVDKSSKLSDRVFIRTDNQKSEMILYKDILFLKAGRAYCDIYTEDKKFTLSNNMSKVFEKFDNPYFIRTHKSYIVNIDRITGIDGNMIKMGEEHVAQMSPAKREMVLTKLNMIK